MNSYALSSLIAFCLLAMGVVAVMFGGINYKENVKSRTGIQMFLVCICVFFWDFGYAWMSLCYDENFAYIPRAIALLAVTFYMFFILRYVTQVTHYSEKKTNLFLVGFTTVSLIAWFQIIQKTTVSFVKTPWGYWYTSKMNWGRGLQFASTILALIMYYVILHYGRKRAENEREKYVLRRFALFGYILFAGYALDTLIPSMFHTPAIPGSCISAFFSAMILFRVSRRNKTFGLSVRNVSEYVFRDVSLPVIITGYRDDIVMYNEITKEFLGHKEEEIQNKKIEDFFEEYENGLVKVVGQNKICKLQKTIVKDQFGDLLYTLFFVQDITKERENYQLAEESRLLAEEASKAKSNFLANMSHEIRTPMNAIIGMSEIVLQEKEVPEKVRNHVKEINIAGNNLIGIINDILDISKIEAGKYELINDEYELPSLLNDVSNIISIRLQETNAKYVLKIDSTMPRKLLGDVNRIRQVLLNVLGNAAKFTHKGSVTLDAYWNREESNPVICFDVIDTGIGIEKEHLATIFGEFNQVDTRKNRNVQGTGLGLAISKRLCEMMDGSLDVESVYGEGSTFHIRIRQKVTQYEKLGEQLVESLIKRQYSTSISNNQMEYVERPNAKVLIVDDTKINLMVASGIMKKYKMQIDTAGSGKEAIEMVQKKDYDIVFMDHMMPEMDGVDATREIRKLGGKNENLVVIALTANAISEAKDMFLKEGMQDFLAKPIQLKALDEILNRWIPVS